MPLYTLLNLNALLVKTDVEYVGVTGCLFFSCQLLITTKEFPSGLLVDLVLKIEF
jgi:hypothetical protein